MKNRYYYRCRISEKKFGQILKLFCEDLNATQISNLTRLSRVTINKYLKEIREKINWYCESESPFSGEVEVDESYFGARRIKGKGNKK